METTHYLNGEPATIIGRENRNEVWVQAASGAVLRVFKAGLTPAQTKPITTAGLKVDPTRRSDGAR